MATTPASSDAGDEAPGDAAESAAHSDEAALAVLVACHHRGPLTGEELAQLLGWTEPDERLLADLLASGRLERQGPRYAATQSGRDWLDGVLEGIESQLSPDDPAYVRRYRRVAPTLPFDANTTWAEAVCVNYRVRPEALRTLVPDVFELDLYDGWAFVSLTASRLKDFGLGWAPRAMRMNFYQATYRAHVSYTDFRGRRQAGCYFVRSDTNSFLMSTTANLLPEFRAHRCATHPILMVRREEHLLLSVDSGADPAGKVVLVLDTSRDIEGMPASSRFRSREDARALIVDFYDAFAYDPREREVFFLRIDRGEWRLKVVQPVDYYLGYFQHGPFTTENAQLDSVFYFTDCPYRWLPLVKERRKV